MATTIGLLCGNKSHYSTSHAPPIHPSQCSPAWHFLFYVLFNYNPLTQTDYVAKRQKVKSRHWNDPISLNMLVNVLVCKLYKYNKTCKLYFSFDVKPIQNNSNSQNCIRSCKRIRPDFKVLHYDPTLPPSTFGRFSLGSICAQVVLSMFSWNSLTSNSEMF